MIRNIEEPKITEEVIQENLKLVRQGKPLKIPLAILNGKFKETYIKKYGDFEKLSRKEYMDEYNKRPGVKERIKKYRKEYDQRPEVKKRKREFQRVYTKTPEFRKKNRVRRRKKYKIPKSKWRVKD